MDWQSARAQRSSANVYSAALGNRILLFLVPNKMYSVASSNLHESESSAENSMSLLMQ